VEEEQILFPYIDALEKATRAHSSVEPPFFQTVRNPIHAMRKSMMLRRTGEADSQRPVRNTGSCGCNAQVIRRCTRLREFEADLHQHVHLRTTFSSRAVEMEAAAV